MLAPPTVLRALRVSGLRKDLGDSDYFGPQLTSHGVLLELIETTRECVYAIAVDSPCIASWDKRYDLAGMLLRTQYQLMSVGYGE